MKKNLNILVVEEFEINSIKTQVGTEAFQKWIIHKLHELFPTRNYNRAIEIPIKGLGASHEESISKIEARIKSIIVASAESEKIKHELSNFSGSVDVKDKENEIKVRIQKLLSQNANYVDFTDKLNQLVESHEFFNGSQ